jgi:hypothetical protein
MRGGKRQGAGRKHRLTPAEREEVAREYHRRMQIYAAAQAHVRDPNIIKRRDIYKQMREVAGTHIAMPGDENLLLDPEEDVIWAHKHKQMWPKIERLKAEFDSISNKSAAVTPKRAKGAEIVFSKISRWIGRSASGWSKAASTIFQKNILISVHNRR